MVKQGYKHTEIGVIPEDWEVKELGEVLTFGSGRDYKHLKSGDIPVYGTGGVMTYVDEFLYQGESVGIGRKGTIDKPVYLNGKFWTVDTLFFTHNFKNILPKYTFYQFGRIPWREYNEASGVPSLNKNTLSNIQIPLPPLPEQEAIASAFSDADAWIESLEQSLAKKRLIKQGAMQSLLTPKEDWKVKKLGEMAEVRDGTHQTPTYVESGIPFYSVESVTKNDFKNTKFITEEAHKLMTKNFRIEKGDVLMTRIGSIGDCKLVDWEVDASFYVSLALLKFKSDLSASYFCHYSKSENFKNEIEINSLQFAIPKKINLGPISDIRISFPTLSEQERIAGILSDMDAELEALENQLTKARQIKQGMMQELLTGRVRLI